MKQSKKKLAKTPIAYEVEKTSTVPFESYKRNYAVSNSDDLKAGKIVPGIKKNGIAKYADGGEVRPARKDARREGQVLKVNPIEELGHTRPRNIPVNKGPLTYSKSTDKEYVNARKDFSDWYSNPATKAKFVKNTGYDEGRLYDMMSKAVSAKSHKADAYNQPPVGSKAIFKSKDGENSEEIVYHGGIGSGPIQHELTHAGAMANVVGPALLRTLGSPYSQKLPSNVNDPNFKSTGNKIKEYMSIPEEAYGNFHEFRVNLGLKPGQSIDKNTLRKLVKEKNLKNENFYNTFEDDKIVEAINKIAYNGNNKKGNNVAAFGGSLDSKKNINMKSNWISKYSKKQNKMSDGTDLPKSSWNTAPSTAGVASASAGIGTDLIGAFKKQGTGINDPLIKRQSVGAEAGKKALQYGAMGAAAGPWGAAIGAGVGAIVGGISALSNNKKFNEQDTNIRDNMTNTKGGVFADVIQKASGGNLFGEEESPFPLINISEIIEASKSKKNVLQESSFIKDNPDFGDKDIFRRAKRELKIPTNTFGESKSVDDLAKPYVNNYDFSTKSDLLTGKKESYFKMLWNNENHYKNLVKSQSNEESKKENEESKKDSNAVIDPLRSVGLVADAFALQQANKEKAPVLKREGIVNMVPRGRVYDESFVANNINKNAYASQQMALVNSGGSKAYARASQKISGLDEATRRAAMYAKVFEMNDASKTNYDTNNQKAYESRVNTSNEDMITNMAAKAQVDKRKLAYRDNMIKSVRDFASEMADKKEITKLTGYRPNDFKYMTPDKRKEVLESYIAFKDARRKASV